MQRYFDGVEQLVWSVDLGDGNAGTKMDRFDEQGVLEMMKLVLGRTLVRFPCVTRKPFIARAGQSSDTRDLFGEDFVHGNGRSKQVAAHKRNTGHAQQAHETAVFAIGAVGGGKDDVDSLLPQAQTGPD